MVGSMGRLSWFIKYGLEIIRWLHGQRKAPAAWIEWEAEVLRSEGFIRDLAAPRLYYYPDMDVTLEIHADVKHCRSVPTPMVQEAEGEQDQGKLLIRVVQRNLGVVSALFFTQAKIELIANMQSRS